MTDSTYIAGTHIIAALQDINATAPGLHHRVRTPQGRADVLRAARARLAEGWTKGSFLGPRYSETQDAPAGEPQTYPIWAVGDPPPEGVCAMGALNAVLTGNPQQRLSDAVIEPVVDILAGVIAEQYPDRPKSVQPQIAGDIYSTTFLTIASFNDHRDTVLDDVLAVFDKAAVRAEEEIA